jgi:hypothetical protein
MFPHAYHSFLSFSRGARAAAHSLLHALSSDHGESQGSLFEYFAVVGLPPTEMAHEAVGSPQTPQLLYAFPEAKHDKCVVLHQITFRPQIQVFRIPFLAQIFMAGSFSSEHGRLPQFFEPATPDLFFGFLPNSPGCV